MGTFVSPFFFLYANPLVKVANIRGEFFLTALIFFATLAISVLIFWRKKSLKPTESPETT
jgi:hypothetical protein